MDEKMLKIIKEEIRQSNEEMVKMTLDNLSSRGLIHTGGISYKNTEVLLYNINKMKASIKDRKDEIFELKNYGRKEKSKSITSFGGCSVKQDEEDIIKEAINNLQKDIFRTELALNHIMRVINKFSNDKYYKIITYKYLDGLTLDEIAEQMHTNVSTISRNKNRLINEIRISLFPNEFWMELCK